MDKRFKQKFLIGDFQGWLYLFYLLTRVNLIFIVFIHHHFHNFPLWVIGFLIVSVLLSASPQNPPLHPEMVRTATPFPMVSLLFVFTAFVISNIGHIRPQRTILAFVSGIFFILSGTMQHHKPVCQRQAWVICAQFKVWSQKRHPQHSESCS